MVSRDLREDRHQTLPRPAPAAAPYPGLRRSHAGRASASFAVPASVMATILSRRSFPQQTETQPAAASGRRLRVSVVSSRWVRPARSPWRTRPGPPSNGSKEILGRAEADAVQLLVVEAADGPRRPAQGAAKAGGGESLGCSRLLILYVYAGNRRLSRAPLRVSTIHSYRSPATNLLDWQPIYRPSGISEPVFRHRRRWMHP